MKPDGGLGIVDLNEWEEIDFPEGDGDDVKQKTHGEFYCESSFFLVSKEGVVLI